MLDKNTLIQMLESIRDERGQKANTARRIGNAFLSLLDYAATTSDGKLSSEHDDVARGLITFLNGIVSSDTAMMESVQSINLNKDEKIGYSIEKENDESYHEYINDLTVWNNGTFKNLNVTGAAHFFALIIDKIKAAGGALLFTPADGFDIDLVEATDDGYRLLWRCQDGNGKQRDNMWRKGDQALCMSFNQASAGSAHNVSNKYYWSLVTGVSNSSSPIEREGKAYNYIEISDSDCDGTVNPEPGDSIVMLGYRGVDDLSRQSAIYISAYSSLDEGLTAPLFAMYRGIDDFDLASHRKSYHDASGSKVVGNFELETGESLESAKWYEIVFDNDTINYNPVEDEFVPNDFGLFHIIEHTGSKFREIDYSLVEDNILTILYCRDGNLEYSIGEGTNCMTTVIGANADARDVTKAKMCFYDFDVSSFSDDDVQAFEKLIKNNGVPDGIVPNGKLYCSKDFCIIRAGENGGNGDPGIPGLDATVYSVNLFAQRHTITDGNYDIYIYVSVTKTIGTKVTTTPINKMSGIDIDVYADGKHEQNLTDYVKEYGYIQRSAWASKNVFEVKIWGGNTLLAVGSYSFGEQGEDGESGLEIVITPDTLVYDTNDDGVVDKYTQSSVISCNKGGKRYTNVEYELYGTQNCEASYSGGTIKITKIDTQTISYTDNGTAKSLPVSVTSGHVMMRVIDKATGLYYYPLLKFSVNVAKFTGSMVANNKKFQTQFSEISNKYDNLPLKSQEELTKYTSSIEQTARKISMSVGATMVGRRNLLVGSEFKRFDEENMTGQGERDACRLRTGDQYDGYNSCRIISESDSYYYNGVVFKRIRVDGNTKYTLTAMAKRLSDSFGTGCYAIIHEFLTKDAEYAGYQHSCFLLTTDDAKNSWVQKSHTFTTHSETRYINVILCVSTFGSFAVCKPMLERGETFGGYSLSEYDYEYIGGNLIDNSRFLKAGGTLVYVQDSVSQELGSDYAIATATASGSSSRGVFAIKKTLKAGVDYVLSWYIKRTGGDEYGQCTVNFGRKILYSERYDGVQASNSVEGGNSPYSGYVGINNLPTEWARMWVHFRLSEDWTDDANMFYIQLYGGSSSLGYITAQFSRPKLEEGAYPTEWTDKSVTMVDEGKFANQLLATGIDIVNKQVTVTADNFLVRNNSGVETLMVTRDGMLNASLVQADRLLCKAANGVTVSIHDGLIYFSGENGVTNIKLGTDETGCAILEFYDQNGVKRYDLGPNGLANTEMTIAQVVTKTYYNLVTILGVGMGSACASITHTSAGSSHTVTQTFYEIRAAYEQKLFGYPVGTGRGVSLLNANTELHQYQAGWEKNGSIKRAKEDSARGLTSEMAKKADGLYFTSKTTMGDGESNLKNLANGTFIGSLNIKENNFRQALLDTYDYIEVPAYYVVIYQFLDGVITSRWLYSHTTTRQYGSGWGLDQLPSTIEEM